jgi:hypothetical protein
VTPEFIRGILSAKGVEIRYFVDKRSGAPLLKDGKLRGWNTLSLSDRVALCFPVARPGESVEMFKKDVQYFVSEDPLHPDIFEELVKRHYDFLENRILIRPILALLQISPSALLEFLGDWEPHKTDHMSCPCRGYEMVEHVLFRLVFATLGDLAITRTVPQGVDVTFAEVRPEHSRAQRHEPALLQLSWKYEEIIGFEAGFDTEHLYTAGGEDGFSDGDVFEVTRNPENCWVRIWFDRYPPMFDEDGIESQIGYSFEDRTLLDKVLTHSSAPDAGDDAREFVKRTAWLGDAILSSVVTESLFGRLGPTEAKHLADSRSGLVSNAALSTVAEGIGLPTAIRVGEALKKNPIEDRHRMHATHLEALIGGVFLDGGFEAAKRVVRKLLRVPLEEICGDGFGRL